MAKSIQSAISSAKIPANWKTELNALKAEKQVKPIKTSTVKVDSKLKPKKHTTAELAKDSKSRHEFSEILNRQFGAVKGYTLGDAIDHSASVYTSLVKQKRNQLEKLNEIGKVLQELRSVIGKSDKEFGQAIKSTALKTMSRQDRSDAMWLSENWIEIQGKMRELDVSSCSASYLRQLLRKESQKSESTVGSTVAESDQDQDSNVVSSTVECSALKLSGDDAESIAVAVIMLAKAKGISLAEIATLILAQSAE